MLADSSQGVHVHTELVLRSVQDKLVLRTGSKSNVLESGALQGTSLEERTTGGPPGHWIGNLAGDIVIEGTLARDRGMNL